MRLGAGVRIPSLVHKRLSFLISPVAHPGQGGQGPTPAARPASIGRHQPGPRSAVTPRDDPRKRRGRWWGLGADPGGEGGEMVVGELGGRGTAPCSAVAAAIQRSPWRSVLSGDGGGRYSAGLSSS